MGPFTAKVKGLYGILPLGVIVNHELSDGSKVYLAFLFAVSFAHDGVSWYSQSKAAQLLGVSRYSIIRYADELTRHGIIDRLTKNGIIYTRIRLEIFGSAPNLSELFACCKNATGDVANLQQGVLQGCHTNKSKEGDLMNENADRLPQVGQRPDPSSIRIAASKAEKLSREAKDRLAKKKWEKERNIVSSGTLEVDRWRGTKFYDYLRNLCSKHDVTIGDMVELSQSTPPRYARAMNDVLELIENRRVSKRDFAVMLEKLVKNWKCGASEGFSKDGQLSIYPIKNNIDRLIRMYGPEEKEEVDEVIPGVRSAEDFEVSKPEQEPKKKEES